MALIDLNIGNLEIPDFSPTPGKYSSLKGGDEARAKTGERDGVQNSNDAFGSKTSGGGRSARIFDVQWLKTICQGTIEASVARGGNNSDDRANMARDDESGERRRQE